MSREGAGRSDKQWEEVRSMAKHAYRRPANKRLIATRGAVVAGAFAAVAVATAAGTAQAAEPSGSTSAPHTAHTWHHWNEHRSFTSYTVKKGDTLSSIARTHKTNWHAIAWANKIHSPYIIHPGQVLKVPTWGSSTEKPASSTPATKAAPAAATTAKPASATTASSQSYPDNLDGWINQPWRS